MTLDRSSDVLVIGAGPAGSVAGAMLARAGRSVVCLERGYFPRHVIGESLLPRCNALLEQAGMLEAVRSRGYMVKPGAMFASGGLRERFSFADALDNDCPDTFQVPRDDFDMVLAIESRRAGVDLQFGQQVDAVDFDADGVEARVTDLEGERTYRARARFVLDCSGFGRVLPRLLDLERPSSLPSRIACFTQIENDIRPDGPAEGDIWVSVHPENGWIWIIPFSNGRTSVGMVCDHEHWDNRSGGDRDRLMQYLSEDPVAGVRLARAVPVAPTRAIQGYSRKVDRLHGEHWALVGNASEFLDPVFSSGVTLALETAVLAARLVDRRLSSDEVDWDTEYDAVVRRAVGVFQAFVESWYRRDLEKIFFSPQKPRRIKTFLTSILGGHVLREDNPIVGDAEGYLHTLHEQVLALDRAD